MTRELFLGNNCLRKKKWKVASLVFFISLFFLKINAQEISPTDSLKSSYQLLFELNIDAAQFTTDKLQNIYYISQKNEVVKLSPNGIEQFRFINKTLGKPTHLDATNPFNLLLFYPNYQNIVTLDRTMNIAAQFNLFELGLFGLDAVGIAGDGNLWLYDAVNFRLKKIGREGQTIVQSADLSLEMNKAIRPNYLLEKEQLVYVNDPEAGILVFDVFGKYLKTLPIKDLDGFQVVGDQLLFFQQGQMYSFHLLTLIQSLVLLPKGIAGEDFVRVEKDHLYVLKKGRLQVYGF